MNILDSLYTWLNAVFIVPLSLFRARLVKNLFSGLLSSPSTVYHLCVSHSLTRVAKACLNAQIWLASVMWDY